jgi:hypothetical protein
MLAATAEMRLWSDEQKFNYITSVERESASSKRRSVGRAAPPPLPGRGTPSDGPRTSQRCRSVLTTHKFERVAPARVTMRAQIIRHVWSYLTQISLCYEIIASEYLYTHSCNAPVVRRPLPRLLSGAQDTARQAADQLSARGAAIKRALPPLTQQLTASASDALASTRRAVTPPRKRPPPPLLVPARPTLNPGHFDVDVEQASTSRGDLI